MDPGYAKKEAKHSSHISSNKTNRRNNSSDNTRSDNNKNYYSPGNNKLLHKQSTFISPKKAKEKGKKDHWEGTAWGDGNLSEPKKKKREWRNKQKIVYSADRITRKNNQKNKHWVKQKKKKPEKETGKNPSKVPFFSTVAAPQPPLKKKITLK